MLGSENNLEILPLSLRPPTVSSIPSRIIGYVDYGETADAASDFHIVDAGNCISGQISNGAASKIEAMHRRGGPDGLSK